MKVYKYRGGICVGVLCCMVSFVAAEVVDFTYLSDGIEDAGLEAGVDIWDMASDGDDDLGVDQVLASRVAELEQLVVKRDRQVSELKQALEDMTATFTLQMAEMRSAAKSQDAAAMHEWADSPAQTSRSSSTEQRRILVGAMDTDAAQLEQAIAAFDKEHQKALIAFEIIHAEAIAEFEKQRQELIATFESKHDEVVGALEQELDRITLALEEERERRDTAMEQLTSSLHQEFKESLADLEEKHAHELAKLQADHSSEVATAHAAFETLLADTRREREEIQKLQDEVSRLEAALRIAQRENEQERFLLAYNSGSLFMAAGRYDRAETELLKALSVRDDDAPLHYNLGVLYDEHLRQPVKARRHYERFLELAPNDRDAPMVMQWLRELR